MSSFNLITSTPAPEVFLLTIEGEFMGLDAINFQNEYQNYLSVTDAPKIIMDLTQVMYIDSAAIGILIICDQIVQEMGKQLIMLSPSPNVVKVLSSVRLLERFNIIDHL